MRKKYMLYQVDAFTRSILSGNAASVVPNASGLSNDEMQKIARELNNSETAFVFPPDGDDHDCIIRFFTPKHEVPICGHATVAAQYVLVTKMGMVATPVRQKTGVGILQVDVVQEGGDYKIVMELGAISFGKPFDADLRFRISAALGLDESNLLNNCPVQSVSTGHGKVMVGINSREALNCLMPDMGALTALSKEIGSNGYHVFTFDSPDSGALVHARMFAPISGVDEDPVTGNANGPLGAYLVHHKLVDCSGDMFRFKVVQGEIMGRPGEIEVIVRIENAEPVGVQIAGSAVVVFQTELILD